MKKALLGLIIVLALATLAAVFFVNKLDGYIAQTIQTEGSKALGVPVSVAGVTTKFKQGSAVVEGLTIANPHGYGAPHAIQIQQLNARVDYKSREITEINIIKPIITAEVNGTKNNFKDLLDQMPVVTEAEQATGDKPDDLMLTIHALNLTQATVKLSSDVLGQREFVMDDLSMRNLSGSPQQISQQVADKLVNYISDQVNDYVKSQVKEKVKSEVKAKVNEKLNKVLGDKLKNLKLKF